MLYSLHNGFHCQAHGTSYKVSNDCAKKDKGALVTAEIGNYNDNAIRRSARSCLGECVVASEKSHTN